MRFCQEALERGVFAQAIRPPTVPEGPRGCASRRWPRTRRASCARRQRRSDAARRRGSSPRELPAPAPGARRGDRRDRDGARARGTPLGGPRGDCGTPFDVEREAAPAISAARCHLTSPAEAPPRREGPRRGRPEVEIELALEPAEAAAPMELFDVEREPRAPPSTAAPPLRGLFVTGTDTGVGKTVLSAAPARGDARRGRGRRARKPVLTGLDDPPTGGWPADHELLGAATGMRRRDGRAAALRPRRLAAPRGGARGRRRSTRPAARAHAGSASPAPSARSSRASAACSSRCRRTTRCAISRSSSACRSWSRRDPASARSTTRC